MRNKVILTLFVVFLIINITPASSVELGEFYNDIGDLNQYNKDKLEGMGYLKKLKLLWKLPKILKKTSVLLDEAEAENKELQKQKIEEEKTVQVMNDFFHSKVEYNSTQNSTENQTVITAPATAIKNANNTLNMNKTLKEGLNQFNSTLLFANGTYDLEPGDIVQLYVEKHFIYACFISQDTANGYISLRVPERQVNMTVYKFQDSFTGLKMKSNNGKPFSNMRQVNDNQNQAYKNKIDSADKLLHVALGFEIVATVISSAGLIGSLLEIFYKFLKNPGSYAKLAGLIRNTLPKIVKETLKRIIFIVSVILLVLEVIGAVIYLIAVILRSVGEKRKENTQQDKDYLNHIIEHI